METWLLLVDCDFRALGDCFPVNTSSGDGVYHLKEKVKEKTREALSHAHVDSTELTMWKTKGAMIIDKSSSERLSEILRNIDVSDQNTIEELSEDDLVADLGLSEGQTLLVRLSDVKGSKIGMVHAHGECCRPAVTIDVLSDDVLLEIFAIYFQLSDKHESNLGLAQHVKPWKLLVKVCQRWRQIICASPRYLDLHLYCSNNEMGIPAKNLVYWPTFPISMCYRIPGYEDDVIAILKNPDRVIEIELWIKKWGKVLAAMQEPFPALTRLYLHWDSYDWNSPGSNSDPKYNSPVLPSGFLGGSAPCLQSIELQYVPFPELPTLLLSTRDLVSLRLEYIPPTGFISPEAMVAGLAVLTRLEVFKIGFQEWIPRTEPRRRRPDPPLRAVLPALTQFDFDGCTEYMNDLVSEIDAPQLHHVYMSLDHLDFLPVPPLFQFIGRTEILGFRRVALEFTSRDGDPQINISLRVDLNHEPDPERLYLPPFYICASFDWSGTHVAHIALVLTQIFTMCPEVDYLHILVSDDHPGWHDDIDSSSWLEFFRLFTTVTTLHIYGMFAAQVARALEDVPGEIVTGVFPSLHTLILEPETEDEPISAEQFESLRQLNGRPVTIRDCALDETEEF